MGKSPGKWMKTLLFGKKSSKSKFSKGKEKEENDKEVQVASKAMENNLVRDQKMSSGVNLEDNLESDNLQHEVSTSVTQNEDVSVAEPPVLNAQEDLQKEQAATKVQTALRGYLARRAFRSLKGVIRLQALARGHLVRRQAVSTLYCMLVIVKLQALARGRKIRRTDIGIEVQKKFSLPNTREANAAYLDGINTTIQLAKLSANGFVRKILASSPTPVPLRFQYDPQDTNSVLSWLERWSASRCWKRVPQPRKVSLLKSQKNCTSPSTVVSETNRVKPSMRKPPVAYVDSGLRSSETDKHRRNVRKVANHFVNPVVEDPQHELEKVKRSLRRVHNPALENTVHPDTENEKPKFSLPKGQSDIEKEKPKFSLPKGQSDIEKEKPKHALRKISNASDQDVSEHNSSDNTEKVRTQTGLKVTELSDIENTPETLAVNEGIEREQDDHAAAKVETLGKNEHSDKVPVMNEGTHEDMSITNERKKSRRRASLPAKQESKENELQIRSSSLPSYMAATESAKAKLRGQGSPRLGQDGPEKSNLTRRYSLPLDHSKSASFSPRVQKPIQMIEKGAIKTDRSLQLSRDGNVKVNQTEWRR